LAPLDLEVRYIPIEFLALKGCFRVGKLKFHHFCSPLEKILGYPWKNLLLSTLEKIVPVPMCDLMQQTA